MTISEATKALLKQLNKIYDERESKAITDWVVEYLTGWKKSERIINKNSALHADFIQKLESVTRQLLAHKPVQYVLHESWFYGMKLYVDENVLIPRPETEELVEWAIEEVDSLQLTVDRKSIRVLDVGTGSGCIPIALKKERPGLEVFACDVSAGALNVAKRNATEQQTPIQFTHLDFLDKEQRSSLPEFNLIISNPPYISIEEKSLIEKHVVEYEPHQALFVPKDDPLIFYGALADFGKTHLQRGGFMMMEMHFAQANALQKLFKAKGYESEIRKDMHGNDRMARVWLSSE